MDFITALNYLQYIDVKQVFESVSKALISRRKKSAINVNTIN